jgi:hypothetical protein
MSPADRVIRWSTALAVLGVAAVGAVASYEHAYDLVRAHGEAGWTARLVPLTVDGLICASSMVMLDSARRKTPVAPLAALPRHRGDARGQRRAWPGRRGGGRMARRVLAILDEKEAVYAERAASDLSIQPLY